MRLLIGIILTLFAAAGVAVWMREDPGYVLVSVGGLTVETSVVFGLLALVIGFLVLYNLLRLLIRLILMPRTLRRARQRRLSRKSRRLLLRGMEHLLEGRWSVAEEQLSRGAAHSDTPLLHYLGAAQAAQQLQAPERRDRYLEQARKLDGPQNRLLAGLSKAELQLEAGQADAARTTLEQLRSTHPRHPRLLALLARSYKALADWQHLNELIPMLRKQQALPGTTLDELQRETQLGLLARAAQSGLLTTLQAQWKQVPKALRNDPQLLIAYAGHLRDLHAADEAAALLHDALRREWNATLVVGYGELGRGNTMGQLNTAESWLKQHPDDPYLLLTLGRLAKRAHKLDKARDYLERSLKRQPSADTYQELGEVLELLNDKEGARGCFRTGLRLLSGRVEELHPTEVLPAPEQAKA
ncbi:MAG TPA: heme biosynthesis HemY N-terminal domain-containing protein [Candidatus Competibacteraceae bacterium]|nr:heme biosynthesis HemY N-terminal domain-containing protein [Candidatus Competibacteraceae bacterium]